MISYQVVIQTDEDGVTVRCKGDGRPESYLEHLYGFELRNELANVLKTVAGRIAEQTKSAAVLCTGKAAEAAIAKRFVPTPAEGVVTALRDVLSLFGKDQEYIVTPERQEAWVAALAAWDATVGFKETASPTAGEAGKEASS